jgi:hypothetical protein
MAQLVALSDEPAHLIQTVTILVVAKCSARVETRQVQSQAFEEPPIAPTSTNLLADRDEPCFYQERIVIKQPKNWLASAKAINVRACQVASMIVGGYSRLTLECKSMNIDRGNEYPHSLKDGHGGKGRAFSIRFSDEDLFIIWILATGIEQFFVIF